MSLKKSCILKYVKRKTKQYIYIYIYIYTHLCICLHIHTRILFCILKNIDNSKNIKNQQKHKELQKPSVTKTYSVGLLNYQTKNESKR